MEERLSDVQSTKNNPKSGHLITISKGLFFAFRPYEPASISMVK